MLFFAIVINILLRPRLPPRKVGPVVEWAAFREPTYVLFAIGMFLIFWALYFGFFYVGLAEESFPYSILYTGTHMHSRSMLSPAILLDSLTSSP